MWKTDDRPGPANDTQVVSCYVNPHMELDYTDPLDPDPKEILTLVHYLRETYPGRLQILGAWDGYTGIPLGQTFVPATYNELTPYIPAIPAVWDYSDPDNPVETTPEVPAVEATYEEVTLKK